MSLKGNKSTLNGDANVVLSANFNTGHHSNSSRSTKNKLKIGECIRIVGSSNNKCGIVKYIGATNFSSGLWIGIELFEAAGKNDGVFNGRKYFDCKPMHGLFVRLNQCEIVPNPVHTEHFVIPEKKHTDLSVEGNSKVNLESVVFNISPKGCQVKDTKSNLLRISENRASKLKIPTPLQNLKSRLNLFSASIDRDKVIDHDISISLSFSQKSPSAIQSNSSEIPRISLQSIDFLGAKSRESIARHRSIESFTSLSNQNSIQPSPDNLYPTNDSSPTVTLSPNDDTRHSNYFKNFMHSSPKRSVHPNTFDFSKVSHDHSHSHHFESSPPVSYTHHLSPMSAERLLRQMIRDHNIMKNNSVDYYNQHISTHSKSHDLMSTMKSHPPDGLHEPLTESSEVIQEFMEKILSHADFYKEIEKIVLKVHEKNQQANQVPVRERSESSPSIKHEVDAVDQHLKSELDDVKNNPPSNVVTPLTEDTNAETFMMNVNRRLDNLEHALGDIAECLEGFQYLLLKSQTENQSHESDEMEVQHQEENHFPLGGSGDSLQVDFGDVYSNNATLSYEESETIAHYYRMPNGLEGISPSSQLFTPFNSQDQKDGSGSFRFQKQMELLKVTKHGHSLSQNNMTNPLRMDHPSSVRSQRRNKIFETSLHSNEELTKDDDIPIDQLNPNCNVETSKPVATLEILDQEMDHHYAEESDGKDFNYT